MFPGGVGDRLPAIEKLKVDWNAIDAELKGIVDRCKGNGLKTLEEKRSLAVYGPYLQSVGKGDYIDDVIKSANDTLEKDVKKCRTILQKGLCLTHGISFVPLFNPTYSSPDLSALLSAYQTEVGAMKSKYLQLSLDIDDLLSYRKKDGGKVDRIGNADVYAELCIFAPSSLPGPRLRDEKGRVVENAVDLLSYIDKHCNKLDGCKLEGSGTNKLNPCDAKGRRRQILHLKMLLFYILLQHLKPKPKGTEN